MRGSQFTINQPARPQSFNINRNYNYESPQNGQQKTLSRTPDLLSYKHEEEI